MSFPSDPALDALSPDDFGRVAAMACALPPGVDLGDERAIMLHLHRERFVAADVAILAPFVVQKARELRDVFALCDADLRAIRRFDEAGADCSSPEQHFFRAPRSKPLLDLVVLPGGREAKGICA